MLLSLLLSCTPLATPLVPPAAASSCGSISNNDLRYYCDSNCGSISNSDLRYLCGSGRKYPGSH